MVDCLFVYADGMVGLRALRAEHARLNVFRVPVQRPLTAVPDGDLGPTSRDYEEYTRQGNTFDGRPIFCAQGFVAREIIAINVSTVDEPVERQDAENRRAIRAHSERVATIELAEDIGDAPAPQRRRLAAQRLRQRYARLIVAVKQEDAERVA